MSAPAGGPDASPVRILVADDDADIRDLVEFKLTQAGYAVEAVPDGVSGLGGVRGQPAQLAVLDVMMPGLSGIDVLRKIRESEFGGARAAAQCQVAGLRRRHRLRRRRRTTTSSSRSAPGSCCTGSTRMLARAR